MFLSIKIFNQARSSSTSVILQTHRYTHFPHAQNDTSVRLRIFETIGEGNFGRVFRGEAKAIMVKDVWTDVAIKMCKGQWTGDTLAVFLQLWGDRIHVQW